MGAVPRRHCCHRLPRTSQRRRTACSRLVDRSDRPARADVAVAMFVFVTWFSERAEAARDHAAAANRVRRALDRICPPEWSLYGFTDTDCGAWIGYPKLDQWRWELF